MKDMFERVGTCKVWTPTVPVTEPFERVGTCKVFDLSNFRYARRHEVLGIYGGYEMRGGQVLVVHRPTMMGYRIRRRAMPLEVARAEEGTLL